MILFQFKKKKKSITCGMHYFGLGIIFKVGSRLDHILELKWAAIR